jgi:thiamine-monophosphate kinase
MIQQYFAPLARGCPGARALRDDAACLTPPTGYQVVITTDGNIGGVHFPLNAPPAVMAHRSLAVNLSDLAAMGAKPWVYSLSLSAPKTFFQEQTLAPFCRTLLGLQKRYDIALSGGDTTVYDGPPHIHVTALGVVPMRSALHREGAKAGDDLYVSGRIGDAGHGLSLWQQGVRGNDAGLNRYLYPAPRIDLGLALRGLATACMDISDGFVGDLQHICQASGVTAHVDVDAIPLNPHIPWDQALRCGDDYELLFTAPPQQRERIHALGQSLNLSLTRVGYSTDVCMIHGCVVLKRGGSEVKISNPSFCHF